MMQAAAIDIQIAIANEQTLLGLDRRLLRRAVRRVLRDAGVRKARISLAVVDDEAISRLNWRYLRHRGRTDVLSFLLDQGDGLEGEVVVAAQTALRTAPHYGWPPHDELLLYVVHGTLHLVGHDDASPAQRVEMRHRETAVLAALGITRRQGRKYEIPNTKPQTNSKQKIPMTKNEPQDAECR